MDRINTFIAIEILTPAIGRVTAVPLLLIVLGACITWLHKAFPFLRIKHKLGEPSQVSSTVPYIGHLIGIFIHKNHYYTKLSQRFPLPILKLPILNGQIYILNSPKLIAAIERQPKVISFWHVEASAIGRIAGLSRETHETVSKDVGDPHSFWIKGLRAIHHTMTLGEGINSMIIEAARTSAETLNLFDREGGGREVDLWDWVCHEITLSHTNAVYGQRNPYKDPQVEAAFWDFSRGSWKLLSGTFSPYLAPKAYHGREKVVLAFEEYFCNFDPEAASPLMQARMTNMTDTLDIEAMARMECVNGLAILANTVPSAFWTLVQVYSHPELLQRVRELAAVAVVDVDIADEHSTITGTGTGASEAKPARKTIDLPKLQRSAPQIQYLIHETIRLHTTGIGPRLVREDVLLQDQYLLRKNSVVVIPNRAIHFDKEVWGDDVDDFRDNRFDKAQSSSLSPNAYDDGNNGEKVTRGKKAPTTAYRGFGGGATVCPGKHFAVDGIAVFVALVVSRYDIFPVYRKGWEALEQDTRDMALQLGGPVERLSVEIVRRKG